MAENDLTFGIIKPDAVRAGHTGNIIQRINDAGFKLRAMKTLHMSLREAEGFLRGPSGATVLWWTN